MAKESIIIFVYDTQMVQKEEDDPASAILYFHPTWVSDQQKAALCGQIMGTIHCIKNIFTPPKIVSLQSGKFYVIENGRYLLAVGTDRNITNWLLEHRARTLYSLVNFFHRDFVSLASIYASDSLSAKMYHIFETYLKMLVFGGNIFSHIPSLALPKSASNVFIEAIHILQCCQEFNHVLGGCMLYHNKVVATQLSSDLTKRIVLTDPYRIKCPAEIAEVSYDLPLGVQLLQVYVSNKEYCNLVESSMKNRSIYQYFNKSIKKIKNIQPIQDTPLISAMKRDQSLIFTAVPEEGSDHTAPTEPSFIPATKKVRPKFLNLKTLSIEQKDDTKTTKVTTPFCGQTSVCSTPMTELKRFVHQNPLSICRNNDEHVELPENAMLTTLEKSPMTDSKILTSAPYVNVSRNASATKKHSSLTNLGEIVNGISKDPSQYFSINNRNILEQSPKKQTRNKTFKTITDPTFPVFRQDGTVVSHPYYDDYLKRDLELVQTELEKVRSKNGSDNNVFKNFDVCLKKSEIAEVKKPLNFETDICQKLPKVPTRNNKEQRKSLTLPLKSLTADSDQTSIEPILNRRYSSGVQLTPLMSKLSMLAFEERSSGFCSRDTTPCDYRGLTPTQQGFSFPYTKIKASKELRNLKSEDDTALQKCVLFVCGQQDIVLTMLLKEECCEEVDTIKKLWEICTEHLQKLEKQLSYCMESQSGANPHESEPYSYLCLDSNWDTVKRGGPWGTNDLGLLNYLHRDFHDVHNVTEILMRGGDSIIYGYHCGPTEVFYHESANTNAGLPPPADPMGLVQLKAKRRLERDHAIILL